MIAILSLLAVVTISMLVTRIASTALWLTGLSPETARFQAHSAFSGTGFTTNEAEAVMLHPDRRRIVMALMRLGSAGLVTAIATLMLSFVGTGDSAEVMRRGAVLVGGLVLLTGLARNDRVEQWLVRVIARLLRRHTALERHDYAALLDVRDDFMVSRVDVSRGSWLADRTLEELSLDEEGVLVLGIIRPDGSYVGSPRGRYTVHGGDTLVLYGVGGRLEEIHRRLADTRGAEAHEAAADTHAGELEAQDVEQDRYSDVRAREESEAPAD